MHYSNDENFVVLDAVDDPIAVDEVLTNFLIIKLWHDASGVRERLELARGVQDLVDYRPRVGWRVTVDVFGYGLNVIEAVGDQVTRKSIWPVAARPHPATRCRGR